MVARLQDEVKKMKCIHCQGKMKRGTTLFHIDRKGCHLMLDSVFAWVCKQCGEVYFEEKEVDPIQNLIKSLQCIVIANQSLQKTAKTRIVNFGRRCSAYR